MKAIRVHQFGGPDALRYDDVPMPEAGAGGGVGGRDADGEVLEVWKLV